MRNDRCRFWLWLWPFPWTVHEREHCNRVTLVTQHLDNRCNLRTLIKSTSGTRSEEDGSKEATGLKGSLSVGCCIKLKLANQTRYRCNLIVILIKIGQDRSKCESSEGVKRVGKAWTWPASFVRYSLFFFFFASRERISCKSSLLPAKRRNFITAFRNRLRIGGMAYAIRYVAVTFMDGRKPYSTVPPPLRE